MSSGTPRPSQEAARCRLCRFQKAPSKLDFDALVMTLAGNVSPKSQIMALVLS
jgi:hypothetical protein